MKMNLPNRLTVLRVILVPVFVACLLYIPDTVIKGFVSAGVFIITSLTDMLDGKIARKYNLVTDFGKFMDPLADKVMVISSFVSITYVYGHLNEYVNGLMVWISAIVILRELGVTSLRLVCSNTGGKVIAANFFGKAKTVTQVICIVVVLIEPSIYELAGINLYYIPSYITLALMTFMTVASGVNYFRQYWKYIDPTK